MGFVTTLLLLYLFIYFLVCETGGILALHPGTKPTPIERQHLFIYLFFNFKFMYVFNGRITALETFVAFCQDQHESVRPIHNVTSLLNAPPTSLPIPPL